MQLGDHFPRFCVQATIYMHYSRYVFRKAQALFVSNQMR